jgi:hypothetical protein
MTKGNTLLVLIGLVFFLCRSVWWIGTCGENRSYRSRASD